MACHLLSGYAWHLGTLATVVISRDLCMWENVAWDAHSNTGTEFARNIPVTK